MSTPRARSIRASGHWRRAVHAVRWARLVILGLAVALTLVACDSESTGVKDKNYGTDAGQGYRGPDGGGAADTASETATDSAAEVAADGAADAVDGAGEDTAGSEAGDA